LHALLDGVGVMIELSLAGKTDMPQFAKLVAHGSFSVYVSLNCCLLASTLTLAQSSPVALANQNLAVAPIAAQAAAKGQSAKGKFTRARAQAAETPQMLGLNFASPVDYGSGGYAPESVAVADVNGDGKPDIVVANFCGSNTSCSGYAAGTVGVLLGNGDGTFRTAVSYGSGGYVASSVAIADVNGDGKPDIVVTNGCSSSSSCSGLGTVGVLLGNGDGTFQTAVTYGSGGYGAGSVAVADVNGDGNPDLLVIEGCNSITTTCSSIQFTTDSAVGVLLNNGNGTFQTAVAYDSGGIMATAIAVGDLNGDGKPDLVVAQCSGVFESYCSYSEVGVMLGNGDGTFQAAVNYNEDPNSIGPDAVALADLNGDGDLDILVTNLATGDKGQSDPSLAVLLGNGNGTFQTVVTYDAGAGAAHGLAIADLTGNGKLDAAVSETVNDVTGQGSNSVAVFPGNGDGTFQSVALYSAPAQAVSVVAAALVGSGLPDLVVGTFSNSSVSSNLVGVLINTSTTAVLSPPSLNFAPQAPGTGSSPQTITLTNIGTAALTLSGISISGTDASGFAETNDCPSALAVNSSCQIKVTSVPNAAGGQTAELSIADNLPGSPQTAALVGTGQNFSLAATPSTTTVTPGQAGNYTLTVSPLSGFAQKIVFSCSGVPSNSTCTASPASVTLNGSASMTANVAIVTAGTSASLGHFYGFPQARSSLGLWLALPGLLGLVLLSGQSSHSHKRVARLLNGSALIGILSVALIWPACGGGGSNSSQTPVGTYNVALAGTYTSGTVTVTQKVKVTLVVQ
jgi:FG-GAP-like repeat